MRFAIKLLTPVDALLPVVAGLSDADFCFLQPGRRGTAGSVMANGTGD